MLILIPIFNFLISCRMLVRIKEEKIVKGARILKWLNWTQIAMLAFWPLSLLYLSFDWYFCDFLNNFGRMEFISLSFIYAGIGFIVLVANVIGLIVNRRTR